MVEVDDLRDLVQSEQFYDDSMSSCSFCGAPCHLSSGLRESSISLADSLPKRAMISPRFGGSLLKQIA